MIYVLYELADGRALSFASVEPTSIAPTQAVFALDVPYAQRSAYAWDAVTQQLAVRPPSQRTVLSKLEFASRYTLEEQVAIEVATETHPDATTRATLRVLKANLDRASDVRLDDPRTILGANTLVDVLVGAGLVQPADRDARVAAILAPVVES